jgi:hypothetical protein
VLTKEQIQGALRGPLLTVDVPEWNGSVSIKRISAADMVRLRDILPKDENEEDEPDPQRNLDAACELLAMTLCDEAGKAMFTADELRLWDHSQIGLFNRLLEAAQKHNKLDAESTEGIVKN